MPMDGVNVTVAIDGIGEATPVNVELRRAGVPWAPKANADTERAA